MASPTVAAVDADRERLRAAVARCSPVVGAAIDAEHAWARARAWTAHTLPDAVVEDVRVGWLLYRPDGSCTLRYHLRLAPSGREQILLVEVPRHAAGIVVRPFPADPALPTLPRALDPLLMREVLGRVVPGTGGDRGVGRCAVDVVRHSRRGRCVLRYRLTPGAGGAGELRHPVVYGKVYADGAAAAAAATAAARVLRAGLRSLPDGPGIVVPRPLAVVDPLHLGLSEAVPGEPRLAEHLKSLSDADGRPRGVVPEALSDAVVAAARMAAAVHSCGPGSTPLATRDLHGERTATDADLALLDPVWPEVAGRLRRGVERTLGSLAEHADGLPADGTPGSTLAHGDFTPGQVLLDDAGRAALVDVDTLCLAEPALDLGRFLAYLHVAAIRRSRRAWPLLADLTTLFLRSYLEAATARGASSPGIGGQRSLWIRTAMFRALALGRLGASACWQLKDERLWAVVDVLNAGNDWMRGGTE